ncbi:LysE family translocator [Propionispora hippei]|uniref:Threonine/homoserine/homoserine lactone efflux protein n=1 Tax=Propionispora hippei DSM 15287 TaxID=1123003 RepID=A0A1M6ICP3_9FIRM|nr:LysE family transporter [Propionispora hippei]SHJ32210.1 Threonine/homoserine/homoserine lactone efflux protein [Propionispora hippei DSM 15287]
MESSLFLKGMLLGFSIAAPVGPIGLLCIQRTLTNGWLYGFLSGLGTATADAAYGFIAAFGITAVSAFLISQQFFLHLLGGLFLLYLGYTIFRTLPADPATTSSTKNTLSGSYSSAFFLTLTNPMTLMSFAAIFAGLGVQTGSTWRETYIQPAFMVGGVFLGSLLWWLLLCGTVSILRPRFQQTKLHWLNRLSGLVIGLFGLLSLATL